MLAFGFDGTNFRDGGMKSSRRRGDDVIRDWDLVQKHFAFLAGDSNKDLLSNLSDMEFTFFRKYIGSLSTDKKIYQKNNDFIININIYDKNDPQWQIGTRIKVFFGGIEGKDCYVKIGDLISYRYCEYECPLNSSRCFIAVTSNISELKRFQQKDETIPESYNTFIEFANLTSKKLLFAHVIYRMCQETEGYTPESEWGRYVTILYNTPDTIELKVYVNRAKGYLNNHCYIKAVFSNDEVNLANIRCLQFYTLQKGTTKEEDNFVYNVDDFLNMIRQRKTLDFLLTIEQKLDMLSFE